MTKERKRVFVPLDPKVFEQVHPPVSRGHIGKTVPEISPYLPIFYQAFDSHPLVEGPSAYSLVAVGNQYGKFTKLALILKLNSKPTGEQLEELQQLIPKEIPVDIPVVYEWKF